jgi:hypothetical protein
MSSLKKMIMMGQQADNKEYPPYLCFEAMEDGFQASFSGSGLKYSLDREVWADLSANEQTPSINAGERIWFKGSVGINTTYPYDKGSFGATKNFAASGKMTSIIYNDDIDRYMTAGETSLARLFRNNTKIVAVSDDFFTYDVYGFRSFYQCFAYTSLPKAVIRISSVIPNSSNGCFQELFWFAAIREVEILNENNINQLFDAAFRACTSLSVVKYLSNIAPSVPLTMNWMLSVPATGSFIILDNATFDPESFRGVNGIPEGWTVYTEGEWNNIKNGIS